MATVVSASTVRGMGLTLVRALSLPEGWTPEPGA